MGRNKVYDKETNYSKEPITEEKIKRIQEIIAEILTIEYKRRHGMQ